MKAANVPSHVNVSGTFQHLHSTCSTPRKAQNRYSLPRIGGEMLSLVDCNGPVIDFFVVHQYVYNSPSPQA